MWCSEMSSISFGSSISWGTDAGKLSIALSVLKRLIDLVLLSPRRSPRERLLDPEEKVVIVGFENLALIGIDLVSEFSLLVSGSNYLTFSALYNFLPLLPSFLAVELTVPFKYANDFFFERAFWSNDVKGL